MKRKFILILLLDICFAYSVPAQSREYSLKAAYIERFTRFVEWPDSSGINDTTYPFILGVIGENPFGSILENYFSTQKIQNNIVEIRNISDPEEISELQLLFISRSEKNKLLEILSFTKGKPILTIGDTEGFAEEGVIISMYIEEEFIRFEINESAVHESELLISYLLLSSARIINPVER